MDDPGISGGTTIFGKHPYLCMICMWLIHSCKCWQVLFHFLIQQPHTWGIDQYVFDYLVVWKESTCWRPHMSKPVILNRGLLRLLIEDLTRLESNRMAETKFLSIKFDQHTSKLSLQPNQLKKETFYWGNKFYHLYNPCGSIFQIKIMQHRNRPSEELVMIQLSHVCRT